MRVKPAIKPPWAERREEKDFSESPADDDGTERPADSAGDHRGSDGPNSALRREQLKALSSQRGWPLFKDIFMLSAVDREDVETLKVNKTASHKFFLHYLLND